MKATENSELKRLMNARLWRLVTDKGGAQKMSMLTGFKPQTFYNMRDNRTFPATDTIATLKAVVPSLNMELLYSMEETIEFELADGLFVGPAKVKIDNLQMQINQWSERYTDLEHKFMELQDRFTNIIETIAQKVSISFSGSGSQSTDEEVFTRMVISGFVQEALNGSNCKVIPLNSLDNVKPMHKQAFA